MSDEIEARTLQEITGHESGAILWGDGSIWIGNWSQYWGLPRQLGPMWVSLGETLYATPITLDEVPDDVLDAMREHEIEQGCEPSYEGFSAWRVNEVIVVVQNDWH